MPRVVRFTRASLDDLARLREFLQSKNPLAARRAAEAILKAIELLRSQPRIGRPVEDMPSEFRELPIQFGDSGYVALYRYDEVTPESDTDRDVVILALRHQREAGFVRP